LLRQWIIDPTATAVLSEGLYVVRIEEDVLSLDVPEDFSQKYGKEPR